MKRFEPIIDYEPYSYDPYAAMKESELGDWVRYESHKQTVIDLNKAQEKIFKLKEQIFKLENQ